MSTQYNCNNMDQYNMKWVYSRHFKVEKWFDNEDVARKWWDTYSVQLGENLEGDIFPYCFREHVPLYNWENEYFCPYCTDAL